jgi:hypothetical protein
MINHKALHGVLTADIVHSTQLDPAVEKKLLKTLEEVLHPYPYEFYRGDSFQVYVKDPLRSLHVALRCRMAAISLSQDEPPVASDIRISIGIGSVIEPVKKPGTARGEAFLLSGRAFDEMQKTGSRLTIMTGHEMTDIGFQVLADYTDAICKEMTAKQAGIIGGLLAGRTQQQMAEELDKSKSTVHQLTTSGRWSEIEKLLQRFETILNFLP